MELNSC